MITDKEQIEILKEICITLIQENQNLRLYILKRVLNIEEDTFKENIVKK